MAVSAYLEAARALRLPQVQAFALLTLDRLLEEGGTPTLGLKHVIAYPPGAGNHEGSQAGSQGCSRTMPSSSMLASMDGWRRGRSSIIARPRLWPDAWSRISTTRPAAAFFDAATQGETALGALTARRKPLQDSPTPAGNPTAAAALLRLEALNGSDDFRAKAEDTLELFAGVVEHFGLYAGSYGLALERLLLPPVQVVVVGEMSAADELDGRIRALCREQERASFDASADCGRAAAAA